MAGLAFTGDVTWLTISTRQSRAKRLPLPKPAKRPLLPPSRERLQSRLSLTGGAFSAAKSG